VRRRGELWRVGRRPAPGDGVYSNEDGCQQWHTKGIDPAPYRCMYSRNINNLFLAGRIISASHVAFGSSRVMATCAHGGQAVGLAAAICRRDQLKPRDLGEPQRMRQLQQALLRAGQYIPGIALREPDDLVPSAEILASSRLRLDLLPDDGPPERLDDSWAMLLPLRAGPIPGLKLRVDVERPTSLRIEFRTSSRLGNFTPDRTLARQTIGLLPGADQPVTVEFSAELDQPQYAFVCVMRNPDVSVHTSETRVTGVLAVTNRCNGAVATSSVQMPPPDSGIESFEYWIPMRRPGGRNLAIELEPSLDAFGPNSLRSGVDRPTTRPNAWVAAMDDPSPTLTLRWPEPQTIGRIELVFDTDYDHPMESVLMGHPERVMPFCVRHYRVLDAAGNVLAEGHDNHQSRQVIVLDPAVTTDMLQIALTAPAPNVPAALMAVRCYAPTSRSC